MVSIFSVVVVVVFHEIRDPESHDHRVFARISEDTHSPLPDQGNRIPLPIIPVPESTLWEFPSDPENILPILPRGIDVGFMLFST